MSIIVIQFVTLDGIVSDPDGADGTPLGGWAFRFGPEAVAGDKFRLGRTLDEGVLLLGRGTWQLFAGIWPFRDDPFSRRMNAVPKLVATRTLDEPALCAWENSRRLEGGLLDAVKRERRDVVVAGSIDIVQQLRAADVVDEYRLLTFPAVLGTGRRLFPEGGPNQDLECLAADRSGAAVLTRYVRAAR